MSLSRLRKHSLRQSVKCIFPSKSRSNACLAITCAIKVAQEKKYYQELGLESFQHRRWYRKLCYFYKIYNEKSPNYLFQLMLPKKSLNTTRNADNITLFKFRYYIFKNSFFSSTINEWNK